MNELRREALALISETPAVRPAGLRRSLREDYLYATDLPQAAGEEDVAAFLRRTEDAGWRTETENGWILMDRDITCIPEEFFRGLAGPEAECCASLLKRHPGAKRQDGQREKRMLVKAGEEGAQAFGKVCGILHREWAEKLRKGESLPDLPKKWFEEE